MTSIYDYFDGIPEDYFYKGLPKDFLKRVRFYHNTPIH